MAPTVPSQPRFRHGQVVLGSKVTDLIEQGKLDVQSYLARHLNGDWGDVSKATALANEAALRARDFLFSCYNLAPDLRLWIITEGDRSATTVLLIRRFHPRS